MIAFIAICYGGVYLLIFNKLQLVSKSVGNICAFAGVGMVLLGTIVFAWFTFAPMSSDGRMFRYIIPIVPNVKGLVVEVPIEPLQPIAKGDLLFRIDPVPYEHVVRQFNAQIQRQQAEWRLAKLNVERAEKLINVQSAAQVDLDIWTANMDAAAASIEGSQAQLDNAQWQLQETEVRAPHDGYVVNLQLRPGNMVTSIPMASSMAFVSSEINTVLTSFSQSAVRRIAVGDEAEVVFTNVPGQTYSGKVTRVAGMSSQSQLSASGQLPSFTGAPVTDRWGVLIALDDEALTRQLPQGAAATVAVYTSQGKPLHVISRVSLRMSAWVSYLTSP